MRVALLSLAGLLLIGVGCQIPAVMTPDDWQRLENTVKPALSENEWLDFKRDIEDRTMTPEEFDQWKLSVSEDVAAVVAGIVDIAPLPDPIKDPLKDYTDFAVKGALLAWLGGRAHGAYKKKMNGKNGG